MNTIITRADVSHTGIIEIIGKKTFRKAFEHLFDHPKELIEYLDYTYDPVKLTRSIRKENNIYLLAWQEGKPVGFAKVKKHSLNDHISSVAQMELQKIYVLFEHHGRGAGTALLQGIENIARVINPDYLWLDTHISNEKAIRVYEKSGFKKIGKHFFTIGTQTFEYHVLSLPVAIGLRVPI